MISQERKHRLLLGRAGKLVDRLIERGWNSQQARHALGAHVSVFTTSPHKKEDALRLGANEVILSSDANQMTKHAGSFDFILDFFEP